MGAAASALIAQRKQLVEQKRNHRWPQHQPLTQDLSAFQLNIAFVGHSKGILKGMEAKRLGASTQPKCYFYPEFPDVRLWKFGMSVMTTVGLVEPTPPLDSFNLNEFDGIVVLVGNQFWQWQQRIAWGMEPLNIPIIYVITSNPVAVDMRQYLDTKAQRYIQRMLPPQNQVFTTAEGSDAAEYLLTAMWKFWSTKGPIVQKDPPAILDKISSPVVKSIGASGSVFAGVAITKGQIDIAALQARVVTLQQSQATYAPASRLSAVQMKTDLMPSSSTTSQAAITPFQQPKQTTPAAGQGAVGGDALAQYAEVSMVPPPTMSYQPRAPISGHIGIAGVSQVGKSSLINALLNLKEGDPRAAPVTEDGSQQQFHSYKSAFRPGLTFFEIPYAHLGKANLSEMSAVCVVIGDRFLEDDLRFVQKLNLDGIPFRLVRSKADMGVMQVKRKQRGMSDEDAKATLKKEVLTIVQTNPIGTLVSPSHILVVSAWQMADHKSFIDEDQLLNWLQSLALDFGLRL